jgi:hypothetical protein
MIVFTKVMLIYIHNDICTMFCRQAQEFTLEVGSGQFPRIESDLNVPSEYLTSVEAFQTIEVIPAKLKFSEMGIILLFLLSS